MARDNLREAREAADLTQGELATRIGADRRAVIAWEAGTRKPQAHYRRRIRKVLNNQDEDLFKNSDKTDETQEPPPCVSDSRNDTLDSSDSHSIGIQQESDEGLFDMDPRRRKINTTIAIAASTIPTIPLATTTHFVLNPLVDAYLNTCETSINTWWHWYNTANFLELEKALNKNVPMLKGIALPSPFQTRVSPYQRQAAAIAVQALIIQVGLATHNMDYLQREKYCFDAVQMGELSGDKNFLALAQFWHANTYTYCYREPDIAIQHLNDALSNVDGNPLIAMRIYSDLSIAHAQNHDETSSLDCIESAYSTMPSQPALDNRLHSIGHAELDQKTGKAYLYLAELLSNRSYALQARDLFEKSVSQAISNGYGYLIQAIIRQADAYRVLGDKDMCVTCLTNAYEKAPSVLRLSQIDGVLSRVPDDWQTETLVQKLQKDVSHALIVAR